ncbi:MAG: protein kinase [Holophagales bacterium]|nr:protein kinase [Holophagales bacterium]
MVLAAGTRLGSFEVRSLLGAGGMGEVYRALDERLGREVAVKVLGAEYLSDPEQLRRFVGEARTASSLNHRNIVTIFEVGQSEGQPFLAMELIDGKTLRQHAAGGLLPLRGTLELVVQVAEGLSAAHEASLVHRDLKPENLMVTRDGTVKILDFGLAKPFGAAATGDLARGLARTSTGIVVGTASYMAPEQARGRPVDFRSDQFCLGLILYELLTGRKAFDKASAVQTLTAIIEEEPQSVELLNPRVPPPLAWIVGRCLAKEPDGRYAATRDLARELKQVRDNLGRLTQGVPRPATNATMRVEGAATIRTGAAVPSRSATVATPAPAPEGGARRAARVLASALGALVLLGGGAVAGWWMRDRTTEAAATWGGDLVLGNTTQVLASRLSPDGQTLAFVTPSGGVTQVAVMKPASGDWSALTNRPDSGSVYRVAWSNDGTRIFFDRVTDVPHGIFSVPAVGGPERLVLQDAQNPEALPDGSLLVVRTSTQGALRIHRFFPETGLVSPLGPAIVAESMGLAVRTVPDGSKAIFWGRLAGEGAASRSRQLHILDLATGTSHPVTTELPVAPPFAVAPDGRSFLATVAVGDLFRLVSVSFDGHEAHGLLTVTTRPSNISAGPDGSYYVCLSENSLEVLRFPVSGGIPDRLGTARGALSSPAILSDGRVVLPGLVAGRRQLLLRSASGEMRPLVETTDQTAPPIATLAGGRAVFLAGPLGAPPGLVLASIEEGRILRRLPGTEGVAPQDLAASPDGRTVYYPDRGNLWSIDVDGGSPPRKLGAGHGIAAFPDGEELLVQRNGMNGVDLFRVPVAGGHELRIPIQGDLRLAPVPLSGRAIGPDGRVVVTVAARSSWHWGPAFLDPVTGAVERIPVTFDGDLQSPGWADGESLVGLGVSLRTELWRFRELR